MRESRIGPTTALLLSVVALGMSGCDDNQNTMPPPSSSTDMALPGGPPDMTQVLPETIAGVNLRRELMITSMQVVGDPVRTAGAGPWAFGTLMQEMAPQGMDGGDFIESWLKLWQAPQQVDGFTAAPRAVVDELLNEWPRRPNGKLDPTRAPFRLIAIVNRMDLRRDEMSRGLAVGAGEGRFVFGLVRNGEPAGLTLIFEFALVGAAESDAQQWACQWHKLGGIAPGDSYNAALQAVTDRFSRRGANPMGVNGSALHQIRTNEISMSKTAWEMREFNLDAGTGLLRQAPLDRTPDDSFQGTPRLEQFILENRQAILNGGHNLDGMYQGAPFQGCTTHVPHHAFEFGWRLPTGSQVDSLLRHKFSLGTCNGCHGGETHTLFTHVSYDHPIGREAVLSGYLTGITLRDPIDGQMRTFGELQNRAEYLATLLLRCM